MALRKNLSVSLSPELHVVAERMLASGRDGNSGQILHAALRLLDEREQALRSYSDAHQVPMLKTFGA